MQSKLALFSTNASVFEFAFSLSRPVIFYQYNMWKWTFVCERDLRVRLGSGEWQISLFSRVSEMGQWGRVCLHIPQWRNMNSHAFSFFLLLMVPFDSLRLLCSMLLTFFVNFPLTIMHLQSSTPFSFRALSLVQHYFPRIPEIFFPVNKICTIFGSNLTEGEDWPKIKLHSRFPCLCTLD